MILVCRNITYMCGCSWGSQAMHVDCCLLNDPRDTKSSVFPSVLPSVTLVDQDHIGWKSWKLIVRTISPTPSLFVAQRPSTYSQGNMG